MSLWVGIVGPPVQTPLPSDPENLSLQRLRGSSCPAWEGGGRGGRRPGSEGQHEKEKDPLTHEGTSPFLPVPRPLASAGHFQAACDLP